MRQRRSSATQRAINSFAAESKIDWMAIRASAYSWTFEELSHYSSCEVSPYVVAVACALCSQFKIATSARKELEDLRQKLDTMEDNSSDYVLRMLTASDNGLIVLGVCGVLNDHFEWVALAEFFEMLAEMSGMPEALRPARDHWLELARIGGKIQPLDSFHTLAQKLSRLGLAENARIDGIKDHIGPMGVVSCIQGMSLISSGDDGEDEGRIIMFCGRSAGWHAAIAEWMFGLKIKLSTPDSTVLEGNMVYANCPDEEVQLTIMFLNPGVPDGEPLDDPPMPIKNHGGTWVLGKPWQTDFPSITFYLRDEVNVHFVDDYTISPAETAVRRGSHNKPRWAVDRITGTVEEEGKQYYQVRWEETLEPVETLQGCADNAIAEFH